MHQYPKKILSIKDQLQAYKEAGMHIPSQDEAETALHTIGYYRLRGYCSHLYDTKNKKYQPGTDFSSILQLYCFDKELSQILFGMISSIEVTLRVRLSEALLIHNDALILLDSAVFQDKKMFWKNLSTLSSEITRSNDVFIQHNFQNHEGEIPLWAAVEVMSFGTLSKTIKNLKTGKNSSFSILASSYKIKTPKGTALPSKKLMSSWIQAVSILRNICAHNSRIYNRAISTAPQLLLCDKLAATPKYNGLYQIILAMKYLRPTDEIWRRFFSDLSALFVKYSDFIELSRMNFPDDWETHFTV